MPSKIPIQCGGSRKKKRHHQGGEPQNLKKIRYRNTLQTEKQDQAGAGGGNLRHKKQGQKRSRELKGKQGRERPSASRKKNNPQRIKGRSLARSIEFF